MGAGLDVGAGQMKCRYDVMAVLIGYWGVAIRACLVAWKHGIVQHSQDEASIGKAERGNEASWVLGSTSSQIQLRAMQMEDNTKFLIWSFVQHWMFHLPKESLFYLITIQLKISF